MTENGDQNCPTYEGAKLTIHSLNLWEKLVNYRIWAKEYIMAKTIDCGEEHNNRKGTTWGS